MSDQWEERKRPVRLERRYQFDNYEALRDFLDKAAEISEREDYFPDMGFGKDYVNITIHLIDGETTLNEMQQKFAHQLDELAENLAQ